MGAAAYCFEPIVLSDYWKSPRPVAAVRWGASSLFQWRWMAALPTVWSVVN